MIAKFSSSLKEKLEKYLASSTFELELYNATSNSNANQASTKGLYLIAEKSHKYEALLTIIARIRQRLISNQKKKWKRINKTVHLIEFMLKNGSFQFVLVFIDKFLHLVKPYANYEYYSDGNDRGFPVRECSKRILELAEDRPQLRETRKESKKLRSRITGVSYNSKKNRSNRRKGNKRKRWMLDEDAFYNRTKKKKTSESNKPEKDFMKSNLARKLGLDEDVIEKARKMQEEKKKMEKDKKYRKARKEQEKEIDEVKKIIEAGNTLDQYIVEVDLLDGEIGSMGELSNKEDKSTPDNGNGFPSLNGLQTFDLLDLTVNTNCETKVTGPQPQNIIFGEKKGVKSEKKPKVAGNFKPGEIDLNDLEDMGK